MGMKREGGARLRTITKEELAALLSEVAAAHHAAYRQTDGVDPEWADWYAPILQSRIGDQLGRTLTRSELVYLLLKADHAYRAADAPEPWPEFYAEVFLST